MADNVGLCLGEEYENAKIIPLFRYFAQYKRDSESRLRQNEIFGIIPLPDNEGKPHFGSAPTAPRGGQGTQHEASKLKREVDSARVLDGAFLLAETPGGAERNEIPSA